MTIASKVTNMGSIIGYTIDYNRLGAILLYDILLQHNLLLFVHMLRY